MPLSTRRENLGIIWPPQGWTWKLPFDIQKTGRTYYVAPSFNLRTYANISVAKTYWVKTAAEGGNNANDGLSEATAFASIGYALGRADTDRVMVKAGMYGILAYPTMTAWGANISPARNIEVIGYGGVVISSTHVLDSALTWSAVDSHYEASYATSIDWARDGHNLDVNGDYTRITKKSSIATVDANVNSWWYDAAADVIYLRTFDDRAPDADICMFVGALNGWINDPVRYYVEGITFWGGSASFTGTSADPLAKLYLKDCAFKYAFGDTFSIAGCGEVILQDCLVANGDGDGIHMAVSGAQAANLALINCISRNNGKSTVTNANSYSRHGPGNTVIVGGEFYGNYGPTIADINDGTLLWVLGCNCHDPAIANNNYYITDATIMWLDGCISSGGVFDINSYSASSKVYYRDMLPAYPTRTGAGLVSGY